jgi:hypothetical protein
MTTTTTHLEHVAEMISDCIRRAKWAPYASMTHHPLQYRIVERDGESVIIAENFGVEIHETHLTGIRSSRIAFILVKQSGCDNGNPETSTVDIDESGHMSAERVAIAFTAACFERYLTMSALLESEV